MLPSLQRAAAMLCIGGAVLLVASSRLSGFALIGDSWPAGTEIVMHLSLSRAATGFQDGSASWNASAADALRIWNEHLGTVRFVEAGSVASKNGDGVNSVFFSSSVYGEKFGTNTIAVTVGFNDASNPTTIVETDVIFNTAERWNSYRGPVQFDSSGRPIYDLKRVALHEFGHVLGLDHPDKKGQPDAHALMNSGYSDNDSLTTDDIGGAQHLYGSVRPGQLGQLVKQLNIGAWKLATDPVRSRVYAAVHNANSVAVIDTSSLTVVKTVPAAAAAYGLTVSRDASKLYVVGWDSAAISVIDLESLERLPDIVAPAGLNDVAEGRDGMLFASEARGSGIHQFDTRTGTHVRRFGFYRGLLQMSPGGGTLFAADDSSTPFNIIKYDVAPAAAQQVQMTAWDTFKGVLQTLRMTHNGRMICAADGGTTGPLLGLSTDDLSSVLTRFNPPADYRTRGSLAFSPDDELLYMQNTHTYGSATQVSVFETASGQLLTSFASDGSAYRSDMVVDRSGAYIFLAYAADGTSAPLNVYATGRTAKSVQAPPPKGLANIATRIRVEPGEDVLIGGLIVERAEKKLLVRAIGPSLSVPGALADPFLEVRDSAGMLVAANDDWVSDRDVITQTGAAPPHDREAAIVVTVPPGAYTGIIRGAENTSGIAVFEVYDLGPETSRLANMSTRGRVGSGDDVMIGGIILGGDQPTEVILRAIGPSLTSKGVAGALEDTTLALHDGNGAVLVANDDWRSDQEQAIAATTIAPPDERESAIVQTLRPGNYTAIVRGKDGRTGVALVEVYNLEKN